MSTTTTTGTIQDGQRVQIAERPVRAADQKTVAYYSFYTGLTGTVMHTYPDGTSSVDIDLESLPVAVRKRHEKSESQLREKWLGDSAEDDPSQQKTGKVRGLKLKYSLLIANGDLIPFSGPLPESKQQVKVSQVEQPTLLDVEPPARASLEEIASKEQAYLDEIARRAAKQ